MGLTTKQLAALRREPAENGNRIAAAVALAGITQTRLAADVGETPSSVNDLIRGRYLTPTLAKARKFADYFSCSIEDLFPAESESRTA